MKNLAILLLLSVGFAHAQETQERAPALFPFSSRLIQADFSKLSYADFNSKLLPDFSVSSVSFWTSPELIMPQNHNLFNCRVEGFSGMNTAFLGTVTSSSFNVGSRKFTSTYIFDMNGFLRGYEFGLSLGKKK